LQLRTLGLDDSSGWTAAVVEQLGESHTGGSGVFGGYAEGRGGQANLLDEVAHLVRVEGHESKREGSVSNKGVHGWRRH